MADDSLEDSQEHRSSNVKKAGKVKTAPLEVPVTYRRTASIYHINSAMYASLFFRSLLQSYSARTI